VNRTSKWVGAATKWVAAAALFSCATPAHTYDSRLHQQLTFIAAKQYNRCANERGARALTPLQVRYVAKANVGQADDNFLRKLVRWNFYDRSSQSERSFMWLIDTRMHHHFNDLARDLDTEAPDTAEAEAYAELGRVISYLQDMTSPAHVVPVYYNRWWRLSMSDRYNGYRVNADALEDFTRGMCTQVFDDAPSLGQILVETADDTLAAVRSPIEGMPSTWEAFWTFDSDDSSWGEYGSAGNNFGKRTEFECGGRRCVLLDDDPLYRAFADDRHARAVLATMQAMHWLQAREHTTPAPQTVQQPSEPNPVAVGTPSDAPPTHPDPPPP
jgi:hypothetical protein